MSAATNKVVHVSKEKGAIVQQGSTSLPEVGDDEILVKNVVVGSNPKDWKLAKWGLYEGIEGNDVAGYVEKVGSKVTTFKVGDKAGSFTKMATHDKYGAYQAYTVTPEHTSFLLGDKMSFEQAAAIPLAFLTAAIGLFVTLKLPEPTSDGKPASTKSKNKTGVLIWGAGSAVGGHAIQLAKLAGLHVVAVAGSSTQYAKDLGADDVLSYKTHDVAAEVEKIAKTISITHAYDAISEPPTTETMADILGKLKGGVITTVLPTKPESDPSTIPSNVKVIRTSVGSSFKEDAAFAQQWIRQVAVWINQGKYKKSNVKVIEGGLDGVPEGLKLLEEGKVNATKLIYRIDDTK